MRLFEDFKIRFEQPNWKNDPELDLINSVLERHPHIVSTLGEDISGNMGTGKFGRKDTPSIEQIVRASIYKELKGLDYRQLEYHQVDSRIASLFIKIDPLRPYSFQMYQKHISRIRPDSLNRALVELNRVAIAEGLEDVEKIRQDTTTVETDIHHPTNNSLVSFTVLYFRNNVCDLFIPGAYVQCYKTVPGFLWLCGLLISGSPFIKGCTGDAVFSAIRCY